MSIWGSLLISAVDKIGKYYGAVSRADFMYKLLENDAEEGQPSTDTAGEFAINLLDTIDGAAYGIELLQYGRAISKDGSSLFDDISADDKTKIGGSFMIVGCTGSPDPATLLSTVNENKMEKFLGSQYSAEGMSENEFPKKSKPGLLLVNVVSPSLNYANRDTGAIGIFMNSIPTLEISRAIPLVNVQVIESNPPTDSQGRPQGMSLIRFLQGTTAAPEDTSWATMANSTPADMFVPPPAPAPPPPPAPPAPPKSAFSAAGMEIFTNPQTLIPATEMYRSYDEMGAMIEAAGADGIPDLPSFPGEPGSNRAAPIIDRMRPFMTLKSVEIAIKPTRGPMSIKTCKISITLHDRSRLTEIGGFVSPAAWGGTEILIEWGWSHPDGMDSSNNAYGQFMNALRTKDKFSVYNSSFSFTDDGQVDIVLELLTKGGNQAVSMDIGMTQEVQANFIAFKKIAQAAAAARKELLGQEGMKDIFGESVIASISPTNITDVINGEDAAALTKWIADNSSADPAEGSVEKLAQLLGDMQSAGMKAIKSTGEITSAKTTVAFSGKATDPFLLTKDGADLGVAASNTSSFARLAALFIGQPLMATGDFDEVQLLFYPMNHLCARMRNYTVGNFPIGKSEFEDAMKRQSESTVQISVMQWMTMMRKEFFNSMACQAYGFGAVYKKDAEGKVSTAKKGSALKTARDGVLRTAYGGTAAEGPPLKFRMPKVAMYAECCPHKQTAGAPEGTTASEVGTVLRIHFVDEACTSYSSFSDLLKASRSSDMGVVSVKQADDATDGTVFWADVKSMQEGTTESQDAIFETSADGKYKKVTGGAPAIKYFIKKSMPTITYGSQNTAVIKANVKSMHNSKMATVHMQRAMKDSADDQGAVGAQDRGLPMRLMPVQLSMDMFGCPILSFMQQFFIDFGTGTSVDNIYAVSTITHKLEPGSFVTTANFVPCGDAYGQYESLQDKLTEALQAASDSSTSPPEPEEDPE